jgi:hypothetical protein
LSPEAKRDFLEGLENMPKKSRKRAAKYSELSKSRKKQRQGARPAPEPKAVSATTSQEIAAPSTKKSPVPAKSPAPQRGPKTQPGIKLTIPDYRYVRDDLKRVGILTGAVIVIIIILAFVLG